MLRLTAILIAFILICGGCSREGNVSMDVLVLVHSGCSDYRKAREYLIPYLDHFGIPYRVWDMAILPPAEDDYDPALVILGHPGIAVNADTSELAGFIRYMADKGTGTVSFDPFFSFTGIHDSILAEQINWITFFPEAAARETVPPGSTQ